MREHFNQFLSMPYSELEERNLELKRERDSGMTSKEIQPKLLQYLENEKRIKAVTLCFTDLEGRFHLLDFDKNHVLGAKDNLTFDGSSIKGFTPQNKSDLRIEIDWTSFRWLPADVFGAGKVLMFSNVCDNRGEYYESDFRGRLSKQLNDLKFTKNITVNVAPEIEGFLFKGANAEQEFDENDGFELANMSGYFNCLPHDELRVFIDKFAEVKRALGFENEKDHPEVAPAQFELNYKYTGALEAADQILLYKLAARQIAKSMGFTASFLPKPVQGINGSGMHTNLSLSKDGVNLFYEESGKNSLSSDAWKFINGVLSRAKDLCLVMNSSVNSYRRLDPAYEAPNEIKVSSSDRGSMVRVPIGNKKSARIEVRPVAPDVNPYLWFYSLLSAGLEGIESGKAEVSEDTPEKLPFDIYEALEHFESSDFMKKILGERDHKKYLNLKRTVAERSPRNLGTRVKNGEVRYHHEVTNQMIWADF
ncbi:glutamine synthetase [Candidatus Peregrinibacteria bacterium]|nr:glutamine synthetase [Candidatus Peregrinibacteria bacterium]